MAKLKLGNAPKNFKKTVSITFADGTKYDIEMLYTYRTRSEYAAFMDSVVGEPKKGKKADEVKTAADAFKLAGDIDADIIMKIAEGWDLDDEFNKENVLKLIDEYPSAAAIISDDYREAILDGRRKN